MCLGLVPTGAQDILDTMEPCLIYMVSALAGPSSGPAGGGSRVVVPEQLQLCWVLSQVGSCPVSAAVVPCMAAPSITQAAGLGPPGWVPAGAWLRLQELRWAGWVGGAILDGGMRGECVG